MRRPSIVIAIPIAAALLAACGSSSSSTSASTPAASTASTSTAARTSSAPAGTPVALVTTKQTKLGTILGAGPKKLTVYLFAADTASKSACSGACATVWPPVTTTTGKPQAGGHAMAANLGTITRADGTMQVTYKGHPLYFYAKDVKDGDAGDTYGQGLKNFGADWYVLAPSGKKIDKS